MNWISENRILVIVIIMIAAIFGLALSQKSSSSGDSPTGSDPEVYKSIDESSAMRRGKADAKVQFIQYSDFLCPSCSYVSTKIMPTIDEKYIETGKVQFEFRPMAFIASGSTQAGMGAYCAVDQNKFWPYHDAIYKYVYDKVFDSGLDPRTDTILTADIIKSIASSNGLDSKSFDDCLDSNEHLTDIQQSTNQANRDGITGTPYLLINGQTVSSTPSLQTVEAMIKANL